MEDSFSVRVGKTFGPLSGSAPRSLWSLTDEEIEKREWNRDKGSPEPEPRPRPGLNTKSKTDFFGDHDVEEEEEEEEEEEVEEEKSSSVGNPKLNVKPDDYDEEQWEIKSSIGLDPTLDHEDEEDGFDKVAVGKENVDRFYMKDVNDYPIDIDSQYEVPHSIRDFIRDPRANHLAAQIRLEQDAQAARKIDYLQLFGNSASSAAMDDDFIASEEDADNLKSILKRKTDDDQSGSSKPQKRVRFDSECKDECVEEAEGSKDIIVESHPNEGQLSGVPDYIRNPSKYTHYTFDSASDMDDEESNMQALMDLHKVLGKSNSMQEEAPRDISEPIVFKPKKKSNDATMLEVDGELDTPVGLPSRVMPIAIAAADFEDTGVCAMEEDEPETGCSGRTNLQRTSRQFRTRTSLELDE